MKKFLILYVFLLSTVINVNAQWTPDETIPVWQQRFVPPADEVDSTFSSIFFKTEKDSFAYADVMNFNDVSSTYGSTNIDTMTVSVITQKDGAAKTLVGSKLLADDVTGYPGFGASQNVITINPAVNSYYNPGDTLTIKASIEIYTPATSAACDSLYLVIYAPTTLDAGSTSTTKKALTTTNWTTYTATLTVVAPVNTNNQQIMLIVEPKFGAKADYVVIANAKAKIYNTNPD